MTPEQRTLRARLAAHTLHAEGKTNTKPAREAFLARFERQVDPDLTLPADERQRRARHALRAHMVRLQLASARARSGKPA